MNKKSESLMEKEFIGNRFRELQLFICNELEKVDGKAKFSEDPWERAEGGGGFTRTIGNGNVIEKGGVAFSIVHGKVNEAMRTQMKIDGESFYATGVSIVLHPRNPHHPIIHMNVRYFELDNGTHWFGGGIDLTPHYVVEENAVIFHQRLKDICDKYDSSFYPKFKPWADTYFQNTHRNESRGIGGIFYDHVASSENMPKEAMLDFAIDLGESFPFIYGQQIDLVGDKAYNENEIKWRNLRRGRYVEFNLVHDRGTKFGLVSNGRTESILMSLPPDASWEYQNHPIDGSEEAKTLNFLSKTINWLNI